MFSANIVRICVRADASTLWKHRTCQALFRLIRLQRSQSRRLSSFLNSISTFLELSAGPVRTCVRGDGENSCFSHPRQGVCGLRIENCANVGVKQNSPRGVNSD